MRRPSDERKKRRQRATVLVVNDNVTVRLRVILGLEGTGVGQVLAPRAFEELQALLASAAPLVQLIVHDYLFSDWDVDFNTVHDAVVASKLAQGAKLVILTAHVPDAKKDSVVLREDYKVVDDQSSSDDTFEGIVTEFIG